ncbi:MAG TPA: radical SAM protein [Terriglobales bacterium]|jgi:DNA repair photolyase
MASLPLLPDLEPRLIGIARLASQGESLREGHKVEYFTLPVRSLLNRCVTKSRMPFSWTINPYRGCEFGCKYCYARYTHEFMEMRDGIAFEQQIYVKQHAADLLRQELRQVKLDESIAIGSATDPYQPAERRYEITRGILEVFAKRQNFSLGIISKSNLILRDLDLLKAVAEHNRFGVTLTITTMNTDLARILEPRAPRPDLRLDAVRQLHNAGIRVSVNCAPILPGITDNPRDLEVLVRAVAEIGPIHINANPLYLKPCSAAVFMPFLEKEFPHLAANYRERYSKTAFLPKTYGKRISELMEKLRKKYGLEGTRRGREIRQPVTSETQLTLF